MPVKIKGSAFFFGLEALAPDASFEHFFDWLKLHPQNEWPFYKPFDSAIDEYKHKIFLGINDNYWYGLFLTARTNEYQYYVQQDGDNIKIISKSNNGDPPVEVNFFCIRKDSKKGIYSHHSGSYAFSTFIYDLWKCYKSFLAPKVTAALAIPEKKKQKEALKSYSLHGRVQYGPLYLPGSFEHLLSKLKKIRTVVATTYSVNDENDRSVADKIKAIRKEYKFDSSMLIDHTTKSWIKDARHLSEKILQSGKRVYNGSVVGFDDDEREITIDFDKTMDNFLNFDYDELGSFNIQDIFTHAVITQMTSHLSTDVLFRP